LTGAEFNPEASVILLNRRCEAKVRRRFGDFAQFHPNLVEDAAKAAPRLVRSIEELARRQGPMLPEDSQKRWAEAASKHKQLDEGHDTYGLRVSHAQWLVLQVVQSCVKAICCPNLGMHRELFGVSGWIANMGKTRLTKEMFRIQMPEGIILESKLVVPDGLAWLML
jgi:hypothetical protein